MGKKGKIVRKTCFIKNQISSLLHPSVSFSKNNERQINFIFTKP